MAEPELETQNHPTLRPLHRKPLTGSNAQHGAYIIKLTDSSLKALKNARSADKPLRIKLEPGGTAGELILGDQKFRFVGNDLVRDLGQGLMQAVNCKSGPNADFSDNEAANKWSMIEDSLRQRIVVKATDETFAETRQKALNLQEEEAKKAGKELTGSGKPKVKSKTRTIASSSSHGSGARKFPGSSSSGSKLGGYPGHSSSSSSKVSSPAGPPSHKSSNAGPPKTHSSATYGSGTAMGVDMSRRPIRDRVIHLLVLKSQTAAETMERLSKQVGGLAEGDRKLVPIIVKEVGKPSSSPNAPPGTMSLNPAFYKDLDINYPFNNSFDKQKVKRALEGAKTAAPTSEPGGGKASQSQEYIPGSHRSTQPIRPPTGGSRANASMPLDSILPSGGKESLDGSTRKRPTPPYSNPPSVSPPVPYKTDAETPVNDVPKSKRSKYSDDSPSSSSADSSSSSSDSSVARSPTQGVAKLDLGPGAGGGGDSSPPVPPPDEAPSSPPPPPETGLQPEDRPPSRPTSKGSALDDIEDDTAMTTTKPEKLSKKLKEDRNRIIIEDSATHQTKYRKSHVSREAHRERRNSGETPAANILENPRGRRDSSVASKPPRKERPPPPLAPKNNHDYDREFPRITSSNQRRRYKAAFEKDYDEYMHCYRMVKNVSKEFLRLDEKLKRADGGRELKKIEEEIFEKYESLQSDPNFRKIQAKHEDLRKKLAVIKERVRVWDDTLLAAGITEPSSGDDDNERRDEDIMDTDDTPQPPPTREALSGNKERKEINASCKPASQSSTGREQSPNVTKAASRNKDFPPDRIDDDYENFSMF